MLLENFITHRGHYNLFLTCRIDIDQVDDALSSLTGPIRFFKSKFDAGPDGHIGADIISNMSYTEKTHYLSYFDTDDIRSTFRDYFRLPHDFLIEDETLLNYLNLAFIHRDDLPNMEFSKDVFSPAIISFPRILMGDVIDPLVYEDNETFTNHLQTIMNVDFDPTYLLENEIRTRKDKCHVLIVERDDRACDLVFKVWISYPDTYLDRYNDDFSPRHIIEPFLKRLRLYGGRDGFVYYTDPNRAYQASGDMQGNHLLLQETCFTVRKSFRFRYGDSWLKSEGKEYLDAKL